MKNVNIPELGADKLSRNLSLLYNVGIFFALYVRIKSLGNFEKYHIAAKYYPPFYLLELVLLIIK